MPSRKRAAEEMEAEAPVEEPSTLQKLRNMWPGPVHQSVRRRGQNRQGL
jgi:hypothetical protein